MIGFGSVAKCTLPLLLQHVRIDPKQITVIDFVDQSAAIKEAAALGVRFIQKRITKENYPEVLSTYLSNGDLCIDLAWNLDTVSLITWCHQHEVLFVNTSVEVWDPFSKESGKDPENLVLYKRQMALAVMNQKIKDKKGATAIVDHGANPGLVSHFTKQALIEIAKAILAKGTTKARTQELESALARSDYPALASLAGVKTIHVSERDSQITSSPKQMNEFVNTWSIVGLIEEGLAPSELGWGTHEKTLPKGASEHASGPKNQIFLAQKGANTWVRSWVPSGPIKGMVIRHGEAFSISDFLTLREEGQVVYRPTVHYAYCPSDSTISSLHELEMRGFVPQEKQRILSDEIIDGKDELGCLLMGHDFKSWWIGSVLDIHEARKLVPKQNATTVQVAIAVVSAAIYAIKHPDLGLCLPDQIDHREILQIAKPYLGEFISRPVDWSPLHNIEAFLDFNQELIDPEDEWQFSTFRLGAREPVQGVFSNFF